MKIIINKIIRWYDWILSILFSAFSGGIVVFENGKLVYGDHVQPEDLEE